MCMVYVLFMSGEKLRPYFGQIRPYFIPYVKETQTETERKHKKTTSSRNFWICREYAFCLRIWSRLCMRMRRPVQDGLYCESLWNPAVTESGIFSASSFRLPHLENCLVVSTPWKIPVYRAHTIFKHETNKNIA